MADLERALVDAGRQLSTAVRELVAGDPPSTDAVTRHAEPPELRLTVTDDDVELVLALPYEPDGPTFDRALVVRRRSGVPEALDLARIEALVLPDDPLLARIPRTPPTRLVRIATLAAYAAFLLVATADGTVDEHEIEAFEGSLAVTRDPVLGPLLAACPVDPEQAIALLSADPPLAIRSLAGAGALFARSPHGGAARATFLGIVRAIASEGGVTTSEQAAIALVTQALDAGEDHALQGPDPFGDPSDGTFARWMPTAAWAPFAGFLTANPRSTDRELRAFVDHLADDPLLAAMIAASHADAEERMGQLRADPELLRRSLRAAGRVFARHPLGHRARGALLDGLRSPARADRAPDELEQRRVAQVARMLDGPTPGTHGQRLRVATIAGVVLAGVGAAWQVGSLALGVTVWFVPVACALQLLVLAPMLSATAGLGARYAEQVQLGAVASVLGGVLIAMASELVTVGLFPTTVAATTGAAVIRAVAGLVGTVVTGVLVSAVLGRFVRAADD